jgi:hypothetical protein
MRNRSLKNLDDIQKEILRLQLRSNGQEQEISENLRRLTQLKTWDLFRLLLRTKRRSDETRSASSFVKEKINNFTDRMTDQLSGKFSRTVENIIDRIFGEKT